MTVEAVVTLAAALVACGDHVQGAVSCTGDPGPGSQVQLECRVASGSPQTIVIDASPVVGSPPVEMARRFRFQVPVAGPISVKGSSLAVSWQVTVIDGNGQVLAETPVMVVPRGGVALWLQRSAPPPG
jgi:hypothetical protein